MGAICDQIVIFLRKPDLSATTNSSRSTAILRTVRPRVTTIQHTPYASLEVVRLGRTEWRVSEASERAQLLGFIERQRRDRFEILWMSEPIRWGYAKTFDSAIVAFGDTASFTGEISLERSPLLPIQRTPMQRAGDRGSFNPNASHRTTWSGDIRDN